MNRNEWTATNVWRTHRTVVRGGTNSAEHAGIPQSTLPGSVQPTDDWSTPAHVHFYKESDEPPHSLSFSKQKPATKSEPRGGYLIEGLFKRSRLLYGLWNLP
jgi:hypothetical protein